MPLTFLAHQAVVLPLKIKAPGVTSGTALVLGSMAPDVEYFLRGYPTGTVGHTWPGLLTFCVPVTLVLYWIITRVIAAPVAANLAEGGDFHLPGYGALADQPTDVRHWAIVAVSALIGSLSHVTLDRLTGGWSSRSAPLFGSWLPYDALPSDEAWVIAKVATSIVLAATTLAMMRHIGRRRLIARWAADRAARDAVPTGGVGASAAVPEPVGAARQGAGGASKLVFWGWTVLAIFTGGAFGLYFRRPGFMLDEPATWVHVWLCSVSAGFIGLVLASAVWHATRWRSVQLRGSQQ